MAMRSALPVKLGFLERPRVAELLRRATRHALVTMIAGPGYGKTVAAAAFFEKSDARLIWMHITGFDGILDHFWGNFVQVVGREFPELLKQFEGLGFPDSRSRFDSFLRIFADEIYSGEQVFFVVDDFGDIESTEIKCFFERLIEANLENFCLVLISAVKTDIGIAALSGGNLYQITSDDLKFTPQETRALFSMKGHDLSQEKLNEIGRKLGGWPVALYLLSQEFSHDKTIDEMSARLDVISAMFERDLFSSYHVGIKKLLVKLSLIHNFPTGMVKRAGGAYADEAITILGSSLFVVYDRSSGSYTFQNMYRAFLAGKRFMLDDDEIREFWSSAGETFLSLGKNMESIDCFEKCGQFDMMFNSIVEYNKTHAAYSRNRANYFLQKLELLPDRFTEQNPLVDYVTAVLLCNNLELDRADRILTAIEKKLLGTDTSEARELLGEVYWLMGRINMFYCKPIFVENFKRSCEYLPNGSAMKPRYLHVGNMDMFNMEDNLPGALERMERAVHEMAPYFVKVAKGGGSGLDHLFSAEAGYFTFNFNAAKQSALKAIYAASEAGQHDILCNSHFLLSRIALLQGNYAEYWERIEFVRDYVNGIGIAALYDLRDCALGIMYVNVGDFGRLAGWIISPALVNQTHAPAFRGRDQIIHAEYLLATQKFYELLALTEHIEASYKLQGMWACVLKSRILRSIALLKVGDAERAVEVFWDAYDMSRHNGVITPFVEAGGNMRCLVEAARKSEKSSFAPEWLDDIYRKSSTCAKRLLTLVKEYNKWSGGKSAQKLKLSKRESGILNNLAQGLTREEMAESNHISVNTVKSVLSSVYNKLGAVNRADAVRIATSQGLLK
ncbi:MAG: LuxR C-terminal-related transcriptional regulator [Synergistaceae bacterium]|jgi:LuxR family maltose regulon positive regulatory protein|nr:LuxR C-terminal-related transcriptional regulator [Synergistaceae bacterium]